MPTIDVAMARSLRPRSWELIKDVLARSLVQGLSRRDIVSDTQGKITDAKTAFSSWDNCMEASFCKWPVIAVIIVGSLIILSVVWCIVRCACCGLSCCCSCFRCLKCCGDCCGCCDPPGGRKHKYLDNDQFNSAQHGYRSEAPMHAPFAQATPQFAEFDVSKKGGEDALPQMPSWDQSGSKKVMTEDDVEMSNLNKSPASHQPESRVNTSSPAPVSLMGARGMNRGNQPYGVVPSSPGGHLSNHSQQALLLNQQATGYSQARQGPSPSYGGSESVHSSPYDANRQSVGFGLDEPYDDSPSVSGTHAQGYFAQRNQPYGAAAQSPYDRVQSPRVRQQTYGQYADMPAMPSDRGGDGSLTQSQTPHQSRPTTPARHNAPMELAGSLPPEGHGPRRQGTADNNVSPANGRPPFGMDPRMRNSPGPRQNATPQGGSPYGTPYGSPSRASPHPRNDQGYGRTPPPSRGYMDRSYSPAPPRQFPPGPESRHSPGPERQNAPSPFRQRTPVKHPLARPSPAPAPPAGNILTQSPVQSPITNNSGFDFVSGYSRPPDSQSPPQPSPTFSAYPGQRMYQPGR